MATNKNSIKKNSAKKSSAKKNSAKKKSTKKTPLNISSDRTGFKEPKDTIRRKMYKDFSEKEVTQALKNAILKMNRRMTKLEKSGLAEYSNSYTRIKSFLKSELKSNRFSSKMFAKSSLEERKELLVRIKHFEDYQISPTDVRQQILGEIEQLKNKTGVEVTESEYVTIRNGMKRWREYIGHSNLAEVFTSDEARIIFTEKSFKSDYSVKRFISQLKKFDTGEYDEIDFPLFMDYYNTTYNAPIYEENGIAYNPLNNDFYDTIRHQRKTGWKYDPDTNTIYDGKGGMYIYENGQLKEIK